MTYLIRPAGPEDDLAIGELLVRSFLEMYAVLMPEVVLSEKRKSDLRAVAERRSTAEIFVAEHQGEVVGTVALWPYGAKGSEAFVEGAYDLRHLAVAAEHRGSSASKQLLDFAETLAFSRGAPSICLHVRRGVDGVMRLYAQRGYRRAPEGDLDKLPEVFLEAMVKARP